jgi:8-oxo-dGTP diphosphatase
VSLEDTAESLEPAALIRAAGALVWRDGPDGPHVAMVHRPRYDDWSWPKGKLDADEDWAAAAVREVLEETGLVVRLGQPLPEAHYTARNGTARPKVVRYWAAQVVGGSGALEHEVDEVAWLSLDDATRRLDYERDIDQLSALRSLDRRGHLATWPLVVVRHAKAVSRAAWDGPDILRPLTDAGTERAAALTLLLSAYGIQRVVTSSSVRCVATIAPFAEIAGRRIRHRDELSEEGFDADPADAHAVLSRLIDSELPTALCTHGPVLPPLLDDLATRADSASAGVLTEAAHDGLAKGEALIAHLAETDDGPMVVAVERHLP